MNETGLRILQLSGEGLCCSQIMIQLALEDMGETNLPLVRAMAGLCEGMGCGDLCGVATGAACVIALYAARGSGEEEPLDCYPLLLARFMEWFKENGPGWGGIRCDEIVDYQGGRKPEVCGNILLRSRETVLALFAEYGIDPTLPRSGHDL